MQLYNLVQAIIKVSNFDPALCLLISRLYQLLCIHVIDILQLRCLQVDSTTASLCYRRDYSSCCGDDLLHLVLLELLAQGRVQVVLEGTLLRVCSQV